MDIRIREYEPKDLDSLKSANEKLHDYVVSLDPIKRLRKMPGYVDFAVNELIETVQKQEGKIYIAEYDNTFVGFTAGFTMKQSEENLLSVVPSKLGVISDVFVEENYREKEIGKLLMSKIESYLKEKGCDVIWIDVVAFNSNAHNFYNKLGYSDREIGLIKKI